MRRMQPNRVAGWCALQASPSWARTRARAWRCHRDAAPPTPPALRQAVHSREAGGAKAPRLAAVRHINVHCFFIHTVDIVSAFHRASLMEVSRAPRAVVRCPLPQHHHLGMTTVSSTKTASPRGAGGSLEKLRARLSRLQHNVVRCQKAATSGREEPSAAWCMEQGLSAGGVARTANSLAWGRRRTRPRVLTNETS